MKKTIFNLVLALVALLSAIILTSNPVEAAKKVPVSKVECTTVANKELTMYKGQSYSLKVKVTPSNASNKKVQYVAKDSNIVKVSKKGKVTALKTGSTTITIKATDGSKKLTRIKITVVPKKEYSTIRKMVIAQNRVELRKQDKYFTKRQEVKKNACRVAAGSRILPIIRIYDDPDTKTFYYSINEGDIKDPNDLVAPETHKYGIVCESSNPKVATVSKTGIITAKKPGTAKITYTSTDAKGATITLTVTVLKGYSCKTCGHVFPSASDARACAGFDVLNEADEDHDHTCFMCGAHFTTYQEIYRHFEEYHNQ